MKVRDVMTTEVVSVKPETTVGEIARLLTERRIHGAPVIDDHGQLLGIVSESDLFLKEKGVPFSLVKLPALFNQWVEHNRLEEIYRNSQHYTAADIMTRQVRTIGPDVDLNEVAELMMREKIHRVPVVEGEKVVGILTRGDLVRWMARRR